MRAIGLGIVMLFTLGACVDVTTPDCSDAAAQCGPSLDGTVGEASAVDGATDGASDAPQDSPVDTGADTAQPIDAGSDAADAADAKG